MKLRYCFVFAAPLLLANLPSLPPPPPPTDHTARCRVYDTASVANDVVLILRYDWKTSTERRVSHSWQVQGNPEVFPVAAARFMTSDQSERYTSAELMLPTDVYPEALLEEKREVAIAIDGPLPRNPAKSLSPDDVFFHYHLEFNMSPQMYYKRSKDEGFLTGFSTDNRLNLKQKFIGFCKIESKPAVKP